MANPKFPQVNEPSWHDKTREKVPPTTGVTAISNCRCATVRREPTQMPEIIILHSAFRTPHWILSPAQARVENIPHSISEQIETVDGQADGQAWHNGHPRGEFGKFLR